MNAMGPPIICEPILFYSIVFGFAVYRSNVKTINQKVKHISTNVHQVSPLAWLELDLDQLVDMCLAITL
jgi:hypothetical protein